MDNSSPEYQRAQNLDKIFKFIGDQSHSKPCFLSYIAVQLRMHDDTLKTLLTEESKYFEIIPTSATYTYGRSHSNVYLTQYGKEQFKAGWTFMKQLEQEESENIKKRKHEQVKEQWAWLPKGLNILLAVTTILFAALTWDATRENKVHNEKEERWEVEKREIQSQFEILSKKYNAIPDSLRRQYD